MQANELRIGNWLKRKGVNKPFQVVLIDITEKSSTTKCDPIPLTEEWLVRFGFIGPKNEAGKYYELNNHRVYIFKNSFEFEFNYTENERVNLFKSYKYVHQLQNIYHSLTGEELKFKN